MKRRLPLLLPLSALLLLTFPAAGQPGRVGRADRPVTIDRAAVRAALARPDVRQEISRAAPQISMEALSRILETHEIRPAHVVDVVSDEGPALRGAAPSARLLRPLDSLRVRSVVASGPAVRVTRPAVLVQPAGPRLDVDGFVAALHEALKDQVVGYVMELRQNGQTIAVLQWNWSRRPGEGNLGWDPDRRMHVASVSKLITAMALVRLLHERGISYDTPIATYLPAYWQRGPNVGQITFRHLLTHRSGIQVPGSATDYATMKQEIAAGVPGVGNYQYENVNFALMRILIPVINGGVNPTFLQGMQGQPWVDAIWDAVTIDQYRGYVASRVFQPSGVPQTVGFTAGTGRALAYRFPPITTGWNSGDLASVSGGAGWVMSADQVLDVMGQFRRGGGIVPPAVAQAALDAGFGVDVRLDTPAGRLYNKNGRWQSDGRAEQSLAYFLPHNMELVVFANSPVGLQDIFFRGLVTGLYESHVK